MELAYVCPHCQQTIQILDPQAEQIIVCPHCQRDFLLPPEETSGEADSASAGVLPELDALRIRQLSSMRRATYRSRSYAIIAACACTVAVAQLAVMSMREMRSSGMDLWIGAYTILAIAALCGAWFFAGRALQAEKDGPQAQADARADDPSHVPDFTPLADGSQLHQNLDKIE